MSASPICGYKLLRIKKPPDFGGAWEGDLAIRYRPMRVPTTMTTSFVMKRVMPFGSFTCEADIMCGVWGRQPAKSRETFCQSRVFLKFCCGKLARRRHFRKSGGCPAAGSRDEARPVAGGAPAPARCGRRNVPGGAPRRIPVESSAPGWAAGARMPPGFARGRPIARGRKGWSRARTL